MVDILWHQEHPMGLRASIALQAVAPAALETAVPPQLAAPPAAAAVANKSAVAAAAAAPSVDSLGIPNLTSKKERGC